MSQQHLSWEAIEAIERGAYRVLLYGPPGTGKTRSAFNAAAALKKSLYNVTLADETPAAELRGHYIPQGTKFVWQDGPAVRAYREGAVLCLDEIDKASQDCLDFLHGLLNDPEVSRLTLPTGEIVMPKDGFQVIATMNGNLEDLQPSLQDRFSIAIEVLEPHPDAIASLPEDLQGAAANVESYDIQQRPATIRRWHAYAVLRELEDVGPENAAKAVFAHRAPELVDAVTFRAIVMEPPETNTIAGHEDVCSCEDCLYNRALARMKHDGLAVEDDDDGDPLCPVCGNYKPAEGGDRYEDAYREAVECCFEDETWIAFCRKTGRPFV